MVRRPCRDARRLFEQVTSYIPEKGIRPRLLLPFLEAGAELHEAARIATGAPDERRSALAEGIETLAEAARRAPFWSELLVTVRTLHTLAILDRQRYLRLIWELGEFGGDIAGDDAPR